MAQSLCRPPSESWILSAAWGPAPPPPPPPSDRDCGCSPASSPNSWGSAAAGSPVPRPRRPGSRAAPRAPTTERRGARSSRLGSGQRRSASEREKLRMRTLARALHALRRFLPPSVAPAGQSLTKIETLRLAIRYIGHLSAVLGLSEDGLRRRRRCHGDAGPARGCPLGPDGGPAAAATTQASSPACPGAPPVFHDGAAWPQGRATEPAAASPQLLSGDVLALLETWMPLPPLRWPPA